MRTFLLFGHGGYYNRGCEAIVISTIAMLRRRFGDIRVILASFDYKRDGAAGLPWVDEVIPHNSPRWSTSWAIARAADKVRANGGVRWWTAPIRRVLPRVDVALSIGGDNYCYSDARDLFFIDGLIKDAGIPLVLWGASVETADASEAKRRDLSSFDLITAREGLTVKKLSNIGITASVRRVADPAFTLEPSAVDTSDFWPEGNGVLGVNMSPLASRYANRLGKDAIVGSFRQMIKHAIEEHRLGVLLVPHVTQPMPSGQEWNDDQRFMDALAMGWPEGRVKVLTKRLGAAESKSLIGKCRLFVGARTHATIAAMSSGVPTICIGYSLKAKGIALDLFGNLRWVVDVGDLGGDTLVRSLDALVGNESELRAHLMSHRAAVLASSESGSAFLEELIKRQ